MREAKDPRISLKRNAETPCCAPDSDKPSTLSIFFRYVTLENLLDVPQRRFARSVVPHFKKEFRLVAEEGWARAPSKVCKPNGAVSLVWVRGRCFPMPRSPGRSEERRVGKECRSRWSPYH